MLLNNFSRHGLCFITLFLSCGMLSDPDKNAVSVNAQSSPCGGFTVLAKQSGSRLVADDTVPCLEETLFWRYDTTSGVLALVHRCISDNCAALLKMYVIRDGDRLVVCKVDKSDQSVRANCMCTFDLYCEVPDVAGPAVTLTLDTCVITLALDEQKGKIILRPLEYLFMEDTLSADLSFLSAYPQLKSIDRLNAAHYSDLSPVGLLINLTSLSAYNIDSIEFLATCTQLKRLEIDATEKLDDISALQSLNNLDNLSINGASSIQDIAAIGNCQRLTSLSLIKCPGIANINPVSSCALLTDLTLAGCPAVTDISPLAGLVNLQMLSLSKMTAIATLQPLANLVAIVDIRLDSLSGITSLEPLQSLTKLASIYISDNSAITDISPLATLTAIKTIHLMNLTSISDFSPLLSCLDSGDFFLFPGTPVPQTIVDQLLKKGVACKGGVFR